MKHTYTPILIIFLIFVLIGFSYYKQIQQEGMENMSSSETNMDSSNSDATNIDPAPPAIIKRGNYRVRRKKIIEPIKGDPFKKMKDDFNKLGDGFKKIDGAFKKVGEGFKKIDEFFKKIGQAFIAIGSNIKCGFQKIKDLPDCMAWYLFEIVGKILYLPITIIISLFTKSNVKEPAMIEKEIWRQLEILDKIIHKASGLHIIHFPDAVVDKCYNCKGLVPFPRF
jgi:hypothetical protein